MLVFSLSGLPNAACC